MTRTYKGFNIYECERAAGEHAGKWIVQTTHKTGLPYADELCPHFHSLAQVREWVNEQIAISDRLVDYDVFTR